MHNVCSVRNLDAELFEPSQFLMKISCCCLVLYCCKTLPTANYFINIDFIKKYCATSLVFFCSVARVIESVFSMKLRSRYLCVLEIETLCMTQLSLK